MKKRYAAWGRDKTFRYKWVRDLYVEIRRFNLRLKVQMQYNKLKKL